MKQPITGAQWLLRIGVSGEFLGHGMFALGIKQSWIPLLTTAGFAQSTAVTLLPIIGAVDIAIAIIVLFWPARIVLLYATLWAFATALIRPLAGDPIWDFVERFANWAAPCALLLSQGLPKKLKDFFTVS